MSNSAGLSGKQYRCVVTSTCAANSPLTTTAATLTVNAAPAVTASSPNSRCGAGTVSLAATASAGTLNWYSAMVGGPSLGTGSPFTTPAISSTTNYYVDATNAGCTTASRTAVLATVNDLPSIVDQPSNSTICEATNASFTVNASGSGLTYQWQLNTGSGWNNISNGAVYAGVNSSTLSITGATKAMNAYQYQVIVGGTCAPSVTSTAATLSVNANPAIVANPSSTSTCDGNNASFSVSATGTAINYQWQENRGSGWNNITDGGVYSGTTVNTLTITGASAAMNNYQYRAALDGACGAVVNSNAATLTVNSLPIVTGNTPATRCGTGTVSLSATATSGTINWFSALTGGSSIGSGSPFTTPSISSTTSYYAEAVNNGCPSASRMAVIATVNNVPSNSVLSGATSICNGSSANLSVSITGGTSPYSVVYNDGTGNSTVNNYTSGSAILVSPSSTKTYSIISITDANSCLGSSNTGTPVITVNAIPSAPTGAAAQSFCSANGPKVSDLSVTGSNITWYDAAPGGSVIAGTTPLVSGTTYYASQTINGCESTLRLAVTATINTSPSAPVIGTITQPTCGSPTGSVDLSGLPSSGTWTITPSLGTPVSGTGSSYTFTNLTASATTTFTVTNASSCISTSSSNAVVNAVPSEPAIPAVSGTTQPTCATPSGTIVFNTQAGVQYSVGSGYQANETFSGLVPGTFTLSVRNIADHSCITTAGSTVTINGIPSAPAIPTVASIAQPTCGTPSGTIVFTTQAGVQYSVGSGYQATETFAGLTPGFYTLTVRNIADNTCVTAAGSAATINAIPPAPSAPTATASQSFCSGNNPKISDIAISGTNIIWYDASPGGNVKASTTALVSGLTYYASQTSSGCESSSRTAVTVTVLACTGPNIADKTINIDENSANGTTVYDVNDVHGSDKDVDGNILSYSILSGNASGAFSIDAATGIITVANSTKLDYETTPSFTLIVRANNGSLTDDASITINLNNLNDTNPVAVADNYNVNEGGTLSVPAPGVLANDYDADGNSLTSVKVTNPAHGTLTLNANGSFSYIHDGSETTSDAFTYKVNDGTFDGNTTTVSITINPVNDPPVVSDVLKALNEDAILSFASVDFTSSYSDADGNALTKIIVTSLPANGTLKLSGANVAVNNEIPIANTVNLTFTPDANWNGTTSFGWNGFDGTVNALSGANVNITVNPVNDAPTVADISKVGNEDNIIPFAAADFTSAFSDIDGNALAKIKITSVPANGTLKISGVPVNSNDEISGVNLGNLTFLPDANWNGNTSFGWNGFDGTTYAVTGALVNITVNPVNDAPVVNNVVRSINEDNILFFAAADFTAEFSDIDGNSLVKIKITSLPANGTLKLGGANVNLSDEIPAANLGLLTFVPDANWNGNTSFGWNGYDGAIYALSDALVTITVNPVNDVPVVNDITKTINEDTPLPFATADFSGAFTDIDGNSMVKIKITGLPSNGMLNLSGVPVLINDEISSANLGNLTFVPDANWNGSTFFGWNGFDGTAYATLNASVNITVIAVNDAPTVSDIYKSGLTDGTITFSASDFTGAYSDVENNTLAKIKVVTLPSNGTLQLSGISVTANSEINAANLGNITFVPTSGFTGVTTFVWNGNDGSLYAVSNANVHLSISAIPNTPPVVSDLSKSVNEDNVLTFAPADFSSAYTDGESNAMTKIKITSLPANATLKLSGVDLAINDEILTASIANLTFVPNANWNGNTSFGWNGFDGTVYATLNASVNITVNAINDPPAVNNVSKSGIEDNTIPFSASDFTSEYSDLEGSAMTKIKISSLPLNGILNLSGSSVSINDEISTANLDNLAFVPDANWNGSTSFSWNGFDGTIYANSDALVNITVSAVNDAPVVSDIAKSVNEDNALAFLTADFTTAFTDVDGNSMAKIKITSLPANGTLKLSGTVVNINDEIPAANLGNLTFVPDANWNGNTSFGWNGQDGTIYALTDADVNILVNPLNDPPVVSDITLNVNEDNILTFAPINFTSSYTDIDGNPLSRIKITSLPANGTLKLSGAAVGITDEVSVANLTNLTFVPDANWNGNTSFGWNGYDGTVYAVSDASVIITVNAVNDPPLVTDFSKIINEDHPLVFAAADFTDAFTDIDGNSLVKIKITSLPVNGTLTLSGIDVGLNDEILVSDLDNLVFVPHANWNGNTSFGWNGFDGTSYAASNANVNITVNAVNDPPFVSNIYKSALTNTTVTFAATDFSTAFTDIENDILTKIKVVSLPLNGILKLSGVPVTAGDELNAAALGNLTFDPAMDWNGSTSFAWNGYDGAAYALLTADADISISATPNTPPVVSDISKSIHEDNTLTFAPSDFAGSFTDGEGNVIAKVKITSLPANGTLKYSGVDVIMNEEISIVTAGNLSFVPDANWNGNTSFRWNGFDGMVYANSDANVNITVIAVNDPPVVSDIAKTILEDNTLTFAAADFTDGFSDVDANSLVKIKITSLPANGKLLLSGADISINDEISIANLGNLTFIPDANWNGNTSFGWNGFDGAVYATLDANVNISIEAVNDAPIVSDVIKSINEDNVLSFGSIDFTTAFSDVDGDALSRVKIISLPANGTLKLSGVTVNPNDEVLTANLNNLTFTPDANWNGNTSFGWNGSDGSVYATLPANVTITVIPVNDPPTVSDIYKSSLTNVTLSFTTADFTTGYSDIENDAMGMVKIVTLPLNGILKLSGIPVIAGDEVNVSNLGHLTFDPATGWNGSTSFAWNANDGNSYAISDANVNITISSTPNTPPVISDISKTVNRNGVLTFALSDFSSAYHDAEGDVLTKIKITSLPANGTLKLSGIDVQINDDISGADIGNFTFVPDLNWTGTTSLTWNGLDGKVYATADASIFITVSFVNSPPVINTSPFTQTMNEDGGSTTIDIPVNTTNTDGDILTTTVVKNPAHGTVSVDGTGKLVYTPNANFNGKDTITYQVCDNGTPSLCATGIAVVTVNPVNDPPGLVSDIITQNIQANSGAKTIDLQSNITNVDGDVLTTSIAINPKHGTAGINGLGQLVYTPDANFAGNDTVTYQVCDNGTPPLCVTGKVIITVTGSINHVPVISELTKTTVENQTLSYLQTDFTSNFTDADNDVLTKILVVSLPSHGTLTLSGVNVIAGQEISAADLSNLKFIPEKDYAGEAMWSWKASDGTDYSQPSDVTITITKQEVFIPEGFSPNGDGINDYFIIKGADKYIVDLKVFNRWGNLVYESKHYQNDWDGISNSGLLISTKLPDGTYYYIVNFNNGEKETIGYITINR
jgi:gliding motility-associated-like protein